MTASAMSLCSARCQYRTKDSCDIRAGLSSPARRSLHGWAPRSSQRSGGSGALSRASRNAASGTAGAVRSRSWFGRLQSCWRRVGFDGSRRARCLDQPADRQECLDYACWPTCERARRHRRQASERASNDTLLRQCSYVHSPLEKSQCVAPRRRPRDSGVVRRASRGGRIGVSFAERTVQDALIARLTRAGSRLDARARRGARALARPGARRAGGGRGARAAEPGDRGGRVAGRRGAAEAAGGDPRRSRRRARARRTSGCCRGSAGTRRTSSSAPTTSCRSG